MTKTKFSPFSFSAKKKALLDSQNENFKFSSSDACVGVGSKNFGFYILEKNEELFLIPNEIKVIRRTNRDDMMNGGSVICNVCYQPTTQVRNPERT